MALETGTYISDLVSTNPAGTDTLDKADDHLRLIKSTVKATFPNIAGAVTPTHTDLNKLTSSGSPQFSTIELGAASDTTISRSAAGVIAVEGGVVPKENRANTFTASQTLSGAANIDFIISGATATNRGIALQTALSTRWYMYANNTAESGSGAGSNFTLIRYSDAGAYLGTPMFINRATGLTTLESLSVTGDNKVIGSGGLGYGYGSGGTVTQATSKSTGVTINKTNGLITTNNASLAANTTVLFSVTNSTVTANDTIIVNKGNAGSASSYIIVADGVGAGVFNISVRNITASPLSEAINIAFAVIKAVQS